MNKLIILLLLVSPTLCTRRVVSRREDNFFKRIHTFIQKAMNKIFILMHLNNNFMMKDKNRLLLSMHANLKAIAEKNYDVLKSIKKIGKRTRNIEGLFNLDRLIDVVIEEKLAPTEHLQNKTIYKRSSIQNFIIASMEIPDNPEEAIINLREYMNNVEGIDVFGFETPIQKLKHVYEQNKVKVVKKKNLKAWRAPNSTEDTKKKLQDTRRVFNGKRVKVSNYPFMASIHIMNEFICGGSILSTDMIITAATCLQIVFTNPMFVSEHPHGIAVRVGSDYTEKFGDLYLIKTVTFHPKFDPETLANNLVILQIEKRLLFKKSNRKIRRIEYVRTEEMLADVKKVLLLGWGDVDNEISNINLLGSTSLDICNTEQCIDTYSKKFVTGLNFCAEYSARGSGACQRDIGGPAVVSNVLVGVVSFGPPICGTPNAPTVFTNVGYYFPWIDYVVKGKIRNPAAMNTQNGTISREDTLNLKTSFANTFTNKLMPVNNKMRLVRVEKQLIKPEPTAYSSPYQRSQPKAVEVISNIINEILTGDAGDMMGDIMEDSSDDDSDDFGNIITENGPVSVKRLAEMAAGNRDVLRNDPVPEDDADEENPFMSILHRFLNFTVVSSASTTEGRLERTFKSVTIAPNIPTATSTANTGVTTGTTETPSANANYSNNGKEDPIMSAISALQGALGLNVIRFSAKKASDNVIETTSTQPLRAGKVLEDSEDEDYDETDNYESNEGMSIEVPTGLPYYKKISQATTKTFRNPEKSTRLSLPQLLPKVIQPAGRQGLHIPDNVANILKNNFVKTDKFSNENSELLVLLLKDTNATNRPRIKTTKVASEASTCADCERLDYSPSGQDGAYEIFDTKGEEKFPGSAYYRRNEKLLDYIIVD